MLRSIVVIGQFANCPIFLGNSRITKYDWAIRELPEKIGQLANCPNCTIDFYQNCPTHILHIFTQFITL